jgi:hypothetical protein
MHFKEKQKEQIVNFLEEQKYLCVDLVEHIMAINL